MPHTLPDLPFKRNALVPHMSSETLDYHHGKHHQAYVDNLNKLIDGTNLADLSLDTLIQKTQGDANKRGIFNNAAQIAHHTFFWDSLSPEGGGHIKDGPLLTELIKRFGGSEAFIDMFAKAACSQFGSGWTWVILNGAGDLEIVTTSNAEIPSGKPLLTCDVWEHAYYIDHRNKRPAYLSTFLENLANWSFLEDNFRNA